MNTSGTDRPGASRAAVDVFVAGLQRDHANALFKYAMRRCGGRAEAEEVVQETLVAAWRHHDQFDPERGSERQWLFGIARNLVTDRFRRSRRGLRVVSMQDVVDDDEDLDRLVEASLVTDALTALSDDHRTVIVEAYYDGRSVREISARHDIPAGTVKSRLFYAMRALRNQLAEEGVLR